MLFNAKQARIDSLAHNEKVRKVIEGISAEITKAVQNGEYQVVCSYAYSDVGSYESCIVRYFKELGYYCDYNVASGYRNFTVHWK